MSLGFSLAYGKCRYISNIPHFVLNDPPDGIISKLVMYADDTSLFNATGRPKVNSKQRQQLCDALNKDLQTISEWGSKWLVAFNSSKTQTALYSRLKGDGAPLNLQMSNSILEEKDTISLLGLTVSSDLSWKSYISIKYPEYQEKSSSAHRQSL